VTAFPGSINVESTSTGTVITTIQTTSTISKCTGPAITSSTLVVDPTIIPNDICGPDNLYQGSKHGIDGGRPALNGAVIQQTNASDPLACCMTCAVTYHCGASFFAPGPNGCNLIVRKDNKKCNQNFHVFDYVENPFVAVGFGYTVSNGFCGYTRNLGVQND